jgi:hypothetical protein
MTVATAANRLAKWLILLVGGPGRRATSEQFQEFRKRFGEISLH